MPLDASKVAARPYKKLQLTETLDERQAKDGKLILEVKGVAQGLVPELADLLTVRSPGFEVVKVEDQPLSVSKFDPDSDTNVIVSDRGWLVTMKALDGQTELPKSFHFPEPKVETSELTYQRYVDADLAKADAVVPLDERYGDVSRAWLYWTLGAILFLATVAVVAWVRWPRHRRVTTDRFPMPDPVTAFTVLGLLRNIQENNGLSGSRKQELASSIHRLEEHFFAESSPENLDLQEIATTWRSRVNGRERMISTLRNSIGWLSD